MDITESPATRKRIKISLDGALDKLKKSKRPKLYEIDGLRMHELCILQSRVHRSLRGSITKQLEPHNLTFMEWLALGVISDGPKSGLGMSLVGQKLNVTPPHGTALITPLINRNLVKQNTLASDRRGRQVMSTVKGRRVLFKIESTALKSMREWNKDMNSEQTRNYISILKTLAN